MSTVRSLADALRSFDADQLEQLLTSRPDLLHPPPTSLGELAERASGSASARLAVDRLNAWQRRVATAIAAVPDGEPLRRVAALLQAQRTEVDAAAEVLRSRALAWGDSRTLHLTGGARQALGPFPAGLAPASGAPLTDAEIDDALAQGGDDVRALVQRLVWDLPVGQVRDADRRGSGDMPADRALALHLLRPREAHTVILPREVSLRLRGGRLFEHPVPTSVPAWAPDDADEATRRRTSAAGLGAAFELVRHVEHVVDQITVRGMRPLATGGLARRDAATLAGLVGNPALGAFVVQLAHSAHLFAASGREWLPTAEFDRWAAGTDWQRWRHLCDAWTRCTTWTDSPNLLPTGTGAGWSAVLRTEVLHQVRGASVGTPVDAERLQQRIEWVHPTWHSESLPDLCAAAVAELHHLGVLALGRRTGLLDAEDDPGFPEQVSRLLVQADLTAISPGPLVREVATAMNLLTQRESVGGAGVHRFTAESVRRALDAGWSADEVREWVERHSDTGVPQPLAYLIDDVARRHGALQVSAVSSVVSVDDPALMEALLSDPRAQPLGLRRIAAGVLGALAEPDEVVALLRTLGHAPIARDASGATARTPAQRRAPVPARGTPDPASAPDHVLVHRIAEDLLAHGDPGAHARGADEVVELLRRHCGDDTWVEVDHVLDDGTPQTLTAQVVEVATGRVRLRPRGIAGARASVDAGGTATLPFSRIVAARSLRRTGGAHGHAKRP